MQKLLKAMPDVRRDYVRELDTALVESRSSETQKRIVFKLIKENTTKENQMHGNTRKCL